MIDDRPYDVRPDGQPYRVQGMVVTKAAYDADAREQQRRTDKFQADREAAEEADRAFEARCAALRPSVQAVARQYREEGKDATFALAELETEAFNEGVQASRRAYADALASGLTPAAASALAACISSAPAPAPVGPLLLTAEDRAALVAHGFTPAEIDRAEQEAFNSRRIS